jgi:hypothetical protein
MTPGVDLGVDGRIILKWKKWTGYMWQSIETGGGVYAVLNLRVE